MSSVTDALERAISQLPRTALPHLVKLTEDALASSDPVDYIARRVQADAAHAAAQETVAQILGG